LAIRQSLVEIENARKGMIDPSHSSPETNESKEGEFADLERLFALLSDLPKEEQQSKLASLCPDPVLRQKVQALLELDSPHDELLDHLLIPKPVKWSHGDRIGNYKLLKQIGEGGMGFVFMAEQVQPVRRSVALKVIKPGVDTREVIARFDAERQALSMMDHPNIAKVLDAGATETGHPFFVMELVHGKPITDYCDAHELQPRSRLELFISVCSAIQHAHQKGIIHRDIKPSNVLVAEYDGRPVAKVIDFGVAKAINQSLTTMTVHTGIGQILGTLETMSPEQTRGQEIDVDTRSDVYSLGVLLYELLAGAPPFDKERFRSATWEEMLKIIRDEDPPIPSVRQLALNTRRPLQADNCVPSQGTRSEKSKSSQMPRGELDWIVMKAMEKDRNRRYQSPSELAKDIDFYLRGDAVTACPPSRFYRFRKLAKRNRIALTMLSAVTLALVLGLIGTSWQAFRATRAESQSATNALKADAVNTFLVEDLLGLAGSDAQISSGLRPDPNVKLITLLERALGQVDRRFEAQPQLAARLKETLASACVSVGRYDDAARLYSEFLQFLIQDRGPSHPDTIRAIRQLATVQIQRSRFAEAESLCAQAIEALEDCESGLLDPVNTRAAKVGSVNSNLKLLMLQCMSTQATVFQKQNRFPEALAAHLKCLKMKQESLGLDHPETLSSMSALAELHQSLHQFDEADGLHTQVLKVRLQTYPDNHPLVAASLHNLGTCYLKRGQFSHDPICFALSEPMLNRCFKIYQEVRGEDHPDTLACEHSLTQLHCERKQYDVAVRLLKDLLDRLDRASPDQLLNLEVRNSLGWACLQIARFAEAENVLTVAQDSCNQLNLDISHRLSLQVQGNLAIAYQRLGKLDQSISLDEQLSVTTAQVLGHDHVETLASKARLGLSKLEIGQTKLGQDLLMAVFEDGQQVPDMFKIAGIVANSFATQDDADLAVAWTKREVESARRSLPPGSLQLAEVLANGGARLLGEAKWGDAEILLRECHEIHQSNASDSSAKCVVQTHLGQTLHAQNKLGDAMPLLIAGYENAKKQTSSKPNVRRIDIKLVLELIIACCDALKETDTSAKFREELSRL
jgi:eukaryotic-like serine/threonine-protein kinase